MRAPNSIDFWRGFALLTIFIDHVPGNIFERYTMHNFALSDAAELFVFLAGVSLRFVVDSMANQPLSAAVYRLAGRAITIYFAQLIITVLAIAILAGAATMLEQPYILQWHNASAVFENPVEAHIGLVALRYQLGYFNILPLYVVLMASAPTIAAIHRLAPWLLFPLSLAIYVYTLATGFNLPTWPIEGEWFFSPSAWQFIFIIGFLISGPNGFSRLPPRMQSALFILSGLETLLGLILALTGTGPGADANVPEPKLFFLFDKTYLSPARLIHCLALVCFFRGAFASIDRWAAPLTQFLSMLGRNSLNVFCVASLLSLCGQVARYAFNGRWEIDWLVLLLGTSGLGFTAWVTEWRQRHGGRAKAHAPAPAGQ